MAGDGRHPGSEGDPRRRGERMHSFSTLLNNELLPQPVRICTARTVSGAGGRQGAARGAVERGGVGGGVGAGNGWASQGEGRGSAVGARGWAGSVEGWVNVYQDVLGCPRKTPPAQKETCSDTKDMWTLTAFGCFFFPFSFPWLLRCLSRAACPVDPSLLSVFTCLILAGLIPLALRALF